MEPRNTRKKEKRMFGDIKFSVCSACSVVKKRLKGVRHNFRQ